MVVLLLVIGCKPGSAVGSEDDDPGVTSVDGALEPGDDDDDDDTVGGDDTGTVEPETCAESPTITVDVAVVTGTRSNDRQLDVTLSEAATVAALCTADGDPTQQHLVESTTVGTTHSLRFQGLLTDTAYTCKVGPTCPTMAGDAVEIAVTTGGTPPFPRVNVDIDPVLGMTGYYTLVGWMDNSCAQGEDTWILIYDADGVVRWWYSVPQGLRLSFESLYHSEDNSIVWGGGEAPDGRAHVTELWDGDTYLAALPDWQDTTFHHDAKRLDDGRILTLEWRDNQAGNDQWTGWGARLHDPVQGTVDFEFDSQRYVDEGWLRNAGGFFDEDPYHANWVGWYDDGLAERLYLSMCDDWSIMSFDAATGDARWKLAADLGWTVLDAAGNELGDRALPQCQHGVEILGDDLLLVYDNGQGRGYSQISELQIDAATQTVTINWQWTEPDWWEGTLGDVDDLGNGRILVTEAHPECWSETRGDRSAIVEVERASGAVASRLEFPGSEHAVYRSERYDGCAFLSRAQACPALADRVAELGW